jgi:hypothetical protein
MNAFTGSYFRVEFEQLLAVFFDGIDLVVYWNSIQSAEYIKTLAAVIMMPTILIVIYVFSSEASV